MDCSCIKKVPNIKSLSAFVCLMFIHFPSYASTKMSAIVDFNIAFILGVSLPVLLFSLLLKKSVPNQWYFFAILSLSGLGFFYSFVHLNEMQTSGLLSFAAVSVALTYAWPFSNAIKPESIESNIYQYFNLSLKLVAGLCFIYLMSVWAFPQLDAYIGWLIYTGLVLFFAATFIIIQTRYQQVDIYRLVGQWLVAGIFTCVMFFWLNAQAELIWLIGSYTVLYVITAINGNWNIIKQVIQKLEQVNVAETDDHKEELLSFARDPATNLPSQQQALFRFEQVYKQNTSNRYAVVVVKPINFEHVNQVLGHQNSDILLLQLAYCLQRKVEDNDRLINFNYSDEKSRFARLQSLHFLAVIDLKDCNYPEKVIVEDLCRQLADAVPEAMSFKSFSLNFELACGVAFTGDHGKSVQEVIAHAGDALLSAERDKDLLHFYDQQDSLYTEQQLLKMERLKQDIEQDNLLWTAEPMIELGSNKIKGFSLTVKWRAAGEEYLPLIEFQQLAENSGELYLLSKTMVKSAFKLLYELKKASVFEPVSISLSSTDILEPDLVEYIEQQIKTYNIAGKYLMIELTEPVMVVAHDRAKTIVDQLRALEVQIGIDDFTGSYESLRYIRRLAVDQLKINCGRLTRTEENSAEKAIVNSLVNLARTMQLPFVGSHINTSDVQNMYQLMGGKVIQGEHVVPGIELGKLPEWVQQWQTKYPPTTSI